MTARNSRITTTNYLPLRVIAISIPHNITRRITFHCRYTMVFALHLFAENFTWAPVPRAINSCLSVKVPKYLIRLRL